MSDERKQEQQRMRQERFEAQMKVARAIMAKRIAAYKSMSPRDDKIKDALCGPYGRFFNEGTD